MLTNEMVLSGTDEVRHVAGDEAGVLGEVEGALGELDAGGPLAELGDAEDPEDDEEGVEDGSAIVLFIRVDEVADPHHARSLLDGVEEGVASDAQRECVARRRDHGIHLLAEQLDEEHPEEDEVGARGGVLGAGLGVHVGHEGQEEREGGAEEEACRRRVAAAVPAGGAPHQAQREQRGAEDGHEHRGGNHEPLGVAQVAGHREVGHQRGVRRGAPYLVEQQQDSSGRVELCGGGGHFCNKIELTRHPGG